MWRLGTAVALLGAAVGAGASSRSTYIPYDGGWVSGPDAKMMALDTAHQQIFTVWQRLDRVDVLSTVDYHLIRSIALPSPSAIDISPDGTTVAVGTGGLHIVFLNTATLAKTNDVVFPDAALGISAILYLANGNAMVRGVVGSSTGGGNTAFWNAATNSFLETAPGGSTYYNTSGPMARSGDYTRVVLGDNTTAGALQIIDGTTGAILWSANSEGIGLGGFITAVAINQDGSRYAACVEPGGTSPFLLLFDSAFDVIYQDQTGCRGMIFSSDGKTLYRDVTVSEVSYTQAMDTSTYATRNVANYFTAQGTSFAGYSTFWQAADNTGMLYGVSPGTLSGGVPWMALDTAATTAPTAPAVSDPVKILHVIDNVGSAKGGDQIRLLATGVDTAATGTVTVTIGGQPATGVTVTAGLNLPNERIVTVTTPAGSPGLADVTLTSGSGTDTAAKGFQYANSTTIIPFATSPSFLLYDAGRNRLYASHTDQVEVIDVAAKTVLTPLTPAGGKLANSQFAGLSLSPDGNRLYIADPGTQLIHMLNLASPGTGTSIDPGKAVGTYPISVARVFELSTGKLLGCDGTQTGTGSGTANLFVIDPGAQTGDWARDEYGNQIRAYVWGTMNQGRYAMLSADGDGLISSLVGLWDAESQANVAPPTLTQWIEEAAANEDGTALIAGGSTPGISSGPPEVIDFNLDAVGYINANDDVGIPNGTPSFFMHPSGALIYKAGTIGTSGAVEMVDVHQAQPAGTMILPEAIVTSYTPVTNHMMTTDATGQTLFAVTKSGITVMTLNTTPLSIGNLQPVFVTPGGGQTLTVRGSGFAAGATVTIGGTPVAANFVDANTLTVETPAVTSGWQDVTVTLPSGSTYTAPAMLQVLGAQATPTVTGFSPASYVVQSGIPGFDTAATVTVLGTNFEIYDTVEINGDAVTMVFLDSGHLQATIPAALTGTAGSVEVTVISPYVGASNSLALPMDNPVPVLMNNPQLTVIPGNGMGLNLNGTGFVDSSTIQWNGQNLTTSLGQGESSAGLEMLTATVPASLTGTPGTATLTVYNPGPGGGVSAPITVQIAPAQPELEYALLNGSALVGLYFAQPSSIDFGSKVLGSTTTYTLQLLNAGTGPYTMSSATVTAGAFALTANGCTTIQPLPSSNDFCSLTISFSPAAAGQATATLTLSDNTAGSPEVITLTGTGILTPVPVVTLNNIVAMGDYTSATLEGSEVVGGPSIPATAWIEYGTDPTLATYTQSASWTLTGDGGINQQLTGLLAGTLYAARLAVQSAGGTGRSAIHQFWTLAAYPWANVGLATGTASTQTVKAGQTATWQMTAWDGGNGYIGTATFTCTGAPTAATCTVTPAQVAVGMTATSFTVTVTTTASSTAMAWPLRGEYGWTLCLLFGAGMVGWRKRLRRLGLLMVLAAALTAVSCGSGGGGSGGGGGGGGVTGTPAGTYTLTLTATTGTATNSQYLQLVVQ